MSLPKFIRHAGVMTALVLTTALTAIPGYAQEQDLPQDRASPARKPATPVEVFGRIDELGQRGMTTNFPGVQDSLLGDRDEWRSVLAAKGVFVRAQSVNTLALDVLSDGDGPQRYSGQRFTAGTSNFATVSLSLDALGLDGGQVTIGGEFLRTTFAPAGPNQQQLSILEYHQRLAGGKFEVKAGFNTNISNFVGIFAGGNPIISTGVGALIPVQAGLSASPATTPSASVTYHGARGFYSRMGVQRSVSARGIAYDAQHNGIGLRFQQRDAKALFISETGILQAASGSDHQLWLRAGAIYNRTRYPRFDGGTAPNWAFYALADRQVLRVAGDHRGVYLGASALFASRKVNVTTRSFELRAYTVGFLDARPSDTATLTLGINRFSAAARRSPQFEGEDPVAGQWQFSALYAVHAANGIYVAPSVTLLKNPSFVGGARTALNSSVGVTLLF